MEVDDGEAAIWENQPIEGAFHEDQTVKDAFMAESRSPLNITNAAVVEDTGVCLEGEHKVVGEDDSEIGRAHV